MYICFLLLILMSALEGRGGLRRIVSFVFIEGFFRLFPIVLFSLVLPIVSELGIISY